MTGLVNSSLIFMRQTLSIAPRRTTYPLPPLRPMDRHSSSEKMVSSPYSRCLSGVTQVTLFRCTNKLQFDDRQWHCQIKPALSGRWPHSRLKAITERSPFRYYKTSPEIIRLAVMMYIRFPLSLRNVEDLLHERGIDISHETVRFWWNRFGPLMAAEIKQKRIQQLRACSKWKWHLDEVFVKINGERHYLWRAVDHEGEVLESYVTKKRDKKAALKFMKKSMRRYGSPNEIVTDKLASYGAAARELGCSEKQVTKRWANNRAENSHLPFRRRERAMLRFRRMHSLQKFASIHASFHNLFNSQRSLTKRSTFQLNRDAVLSEWRSFADLIEKDRTPQY